MKVEKTEDWDEITLRGTRKVTLFKNLTRIMFSKDGKGPNFTINEMKKIIPQLQRAVDTLEFKIPTEYEKIEVGEDAFVIRRKKVWDYYNRGDFCRKACSVYTEEEADKVLANLRGEEE